MGRLSNFLNWCLNCIPVRSVDRVRVDRNERKIQFYIVLYGLLLSSGDELLSADIGFLLISLFFMMAICYYEHVCNLNGVGGAWNPVMLILVNFLAFFISLLFSLSVQLRYVAALNWPVNLGLIDGVAFSSVDLIRTFLLWAGVFLMFLVIYRSLRF